MALVPGNKSSLADKRADILERSQDRRLTQPSQRNGGVDVRTEIQNRGRHVSKHLLLRPEGPRSSCDPDYDSATTDVGSAWSPQTGATFKLCWCTCRREEQLRPPPRTQGIQLALLFENTPWKKYVKTQIFTTKLLGDIVF